jgi:tRNA threonylcarbamoyladenosine biosynthesis protein TsaB
VPVLALDTSIKPAGAALAREGRILAEMHLMASRTPSRQLLPGIDFLLKTSGLSRDDITGLAVSLGPGYFTGLRIGLASAQGLAMGLGIKCAGISTLRILAQGMVAHEGLIWAVADARRGLVYAAPFESNGKKLKRLAPDAAMTIPRLARDICTPALLVGDGGPLCLDELKGRDMRLAPKWAEIPRAGLLALIGEKRLLRGEAMEPGELAPRYLRPSDAEIRFGLPLDGYRLLD